jgi:hypothetical protein
MTISPALAASTTETGVAPMSAANAVRLSGPLEFAIKTSWSSWRDGAQVSPHASSTDDSNLHVHVNPKNSQSALPGRTDWPANTQRISRLKHAKNQTFIWNVTRLQVMTNAT